MTTPTPSGTITREAALDRLRAGMVIAFATETVWGLGADATNADAVERVYGMKGRPKHKPMPVLVADLAMADGITTGLSGRARRLAEAFWPGPLTLVCPAARSIPGIVTGGGDTVAMRAPGLPALLELIRLLGRPIIAPSANRSGESPARTIDELRAHFADELACGTLACFAPPGSTGRGSEPSTIVAPGDRPGADRVLRDGPITAEELARII
jgi:L-threonylcarbamoyladenylate synthase